MEMRISEIIEILEKEIEPGADLGESSQWWKDDFAAGIEHCIGVLSEIRDREEVTE